MIRGNFKKWSSVIFVVFAFLFAVGCTDVSTDKPETKVDTMPPTISSKDLTVEYGMSLNYSDLVSVVDDSSDEVQLSVVNSDIEGVAIDENNQSIVVNKVGTYELTVSAADASGNASEARVLIVVEDYVQPVLSLAQTTFSLTAGDVAPDYSSIASAKDNVDGDLTAAISVDSSEVNCNVAGTYEVIYTVTDSSGNVTTQTATVQVAAKPHLAPSNNTTSNETSSGSGESEVMITRTGECYHRRKCGNGNYFWVPFSEAQSRGLRPCKKCY